MREGNGGAENPGRWLILASSEFAVGNFDGRWYLFKDFSSQEVFMEEGVCDGLYL